MSHSYHCDRICRRRVTGRIRPLVLLAALCIAGWVPAARAQPSDGVSVAPCARALQPLPGGAASDAIRRYQQRAAAHPVYLARLGRAYLARVGPSTVIDYLGLADDTASCMELRSGDVQAARLLRGNVRLRQHRFREAEAVGRSLARDRGRWFDYALWGDSLLELGRLAEAGRAYQAMMDLRPGPEAYSRAARVLWLQGEVAGAIEFMRMSVRGMGLRNPPALAWAYVHLATYLWQAGQAQEAAWCLGRALQWVPAYPPALAMQGRLLLANQRYHEAVKVLRQAVESDPQVEYYWSLLEAQQAAASLSGQAELQAWLANHGAQQDPRTYALYLASTRRQPRQAEGLAAAELARRQDAHTLDVYAWALHANGRTEQARDFTQRALASGIEDARIYYHAGRIAAALGRAEEARTYLNKAQSLAFMLLPSERRGLERELAALVPRSQKPHLVPLVQAPGLN